MTKKIKLSRHLVDLKILWWELVENRTYSQADKEQLHKIIWEDGITEIENQIKFYEQRIENAKMILNKIERLK